MILQIMITATAQAQLSPGPLSRPHAHLEGIKKCDQCHEMGNRQVGDKCVGCHVEIAAERKAGKGLHAEPAFARCVDCHTEHHGADYDLVFWKDGRDTFDHRRAGWELTGAHAKLDCRKCHNVKYVANPASLTSRHKELDRTFLGLPTDCVACHGDHHRGQMKVDGKPRACSGCHDTARWKPVATFDHAKTAFPLTGRHLQAACAKCHPALPALPTDHGQAPTAKYTPVAHANCTDCHQDKHAGQLGPECAKCHVTEGWKIINGGGFDHAKTKYPLLGRHARVTCGECHGGGRKKPPFAACRDCHRDAHDGEARQRPAWLACDTCHTVEGFRPARFGLEQHAKSAYPLAGAHQAVPCLLCHKPLAKAAGLKAPYATAPELKPEAARCTDCHREPHLGQGDRFAVDAKAGACVACHNQDSWRKVAFDHDRAEFRLDGRHLKVACLACHKPVAATTKEPRAVPFKVAAKHCAACHKDPHKGQFDDRPVAGTQAADCARCHVTTDWLAEKFDHEKDSRFPLRGGHEKVACAKCHLPVPGDGPRLLHFKPLPTDCRACHANPPAGQKGQS